MTLFEVQELNNLDLVLSIDKISQLSGKLKSNLEKVGYRGTRHDEFKPGFTKLREIAVMVSRLELNDENFFVLPCLTDTDDGINIPACLFLAIIEGETKVIGMLGVFEDLIDTNATIGQENLKLFPAEINAIRKLAFELNIRYDSEDLIDFNN